MSIDDDDGDGDGEWCAMPFGYEEMNNFNFELLLGGGDGGISGEGER